MRVPHVALLAALALAGCANPDRSRNLADPSVSAAVLARQVCSNCHGMTGVSASPNFPNLAGQVGSYTAAQLRGFRSHSRQDPAGFQYMWGMSRGLSDAQIDGLAAYYAAQTPARLPADGDPGQLAAGRQLFEAGRLDKGVPACSSCHGAQGEGSPAAPRLAGQHADYLGKQLMVFQRGDERPEGSIMKTIAHGMTPKDIDDVAALLQRMPLP